MSSAGPTLDVATAEPGSQRSVPDARHDRIAPARFGDMLVIAAPALLALGLCLYQLTTRSLWLDESATVAIASQHGGAFGAALARDGGNMLGYYALLHVLIGAFGSGTLVLRLPSAVAAAATAGLVGVLALRLADRWVALLAGVFTAVSLSLVYWGQNARGYMPMVALVVASFVALHAVLEGGGPGPWLAYVVSTTAAVYFGLEAVLVIPAQLLALVWFRARWRALLSAVAVTALCCVPLAVLAAERGGGQLFWVPGPSLTVFKQIVQALTSSGLQPSFYTSTTTALLVLTVAVLLAGTIRIWQLWRTGAGIWQPLLMLGWLVVPGLVALIESAVGQSVFQARYLLVSLPAVSLLLAWTLGDRRFVGGRTALRWISVGLVGALVALRALQLAPAYGASSENWRAATAYVVADSKPRDCIAFYPQDTRMAFRYYLRDFARAPRPILPRLPWSQVRSFVEDYASLPPAAVARLPLTCARVWLISRRGGGAGGTSISHGNALRLERLRSDLAREYPVSQTRNFGYAQLVTVALYAR